VGSFAQIWAASEEKVKLARQLRRPNQHRRPLSLRKVSAALVSAAISRQGLRSCGLKISGNILRKAQELAGEWRWIGEAMSTAATTKESWFEAEVNRIAGEIALLWPEPDVTKAEASFERALTIARQQQAKSWELRAAMSLARLWRDQGRVQQARELLAPVYGGSPKGLTRAI
jgi:hypothetical protein